MAKTARQDSQLLTVASSHSPFAHPEPCIYPKLALNQQPKTANQQGVNVWAAAAVTQDLVEM